MNTLDIQKYYTQTEGDISPIDSIMTTFTHQSQALAKMAKEADTEQYQRAIGYMLKCKGHVIVCGMGKSGHVGKKISATLASTGTPSFFLHPSEAFHGDLGMITRDDVLILISNSGETDEVLKLIPSLKSFGNKVISITGDETSTLSQNSDASLILVSAKESCPNNLAPTTSTTLTIALGDALAVALMQVRKFEPNDFARFHPGGSLGRRLLTKVENVMVKKNLPLVDVDTPMADVVLRMNEGRQGVAIVTENDHLVGIITDGDLRRTLTNMAMFSEIKAKDVMTFRPKSCYQSDMLSDAEQKMRRYAISTLVVLNDEDKVVGLIRIFNT
ncbi:KpsF/GutQ family sugar-phosphate isomerase [Vibrio sp. TRT 21S02]|uniref:KpsF/GutQ family sugar-phosphate isomerase n=1 Tax=unclassified Vibrio TaxID=2614977 RepID=UPI003CE78E22